ncbi:MAG: hypothetical protein V7724_04155 [Sediminicola sp.]
MFFILVAMLVVARTVYENEAVDVDFATTHGKDSLNREGNTAPLMDEMAMGQSPMKKQ